MFYIIVAVIVVLVLTVTVLLTKGKNEVIEDKNKIKGGIGERRTAEEFKQYFERSLINYKVLNNVYLKFNNGNTTEIDILIISEYGLFVVENKNYRGWIFGSFKDKYWTDSYKGGKKVKFYNPLKQNYTHIRTLKNHIDEKYHNMIYSYIVFSGECELKKVPYNSEYIKIIKDNQVQETLQEPFNKCINADEIESIYNSLKMFSDVQENEKEEHIKKIKEKI